MDYWGVDTGEQVKVTRREGNSRVRRLQRLRRLLCERSFAHTCETGGGRRNWLRALVNVSKRYVIHAAAYNRGVILRKLFGVGTPRSLQGRAAAACAALLAVLWSWCHWVAARTADTHHSTTMPPPITAGTLRFAAA